MAQSITTLPAWPGAEHCYSKANRLLEKWGAANYAAAKARHKGKRTVPCPAPTAEINALVLALNQGDEERIKGILLLGDAFHAY